MMEFLDVVDEKDKVIGKASKDDIYKKSLRHRIVHVMIFNDKGEMVLQMRSSNVSFCPDHWSTSVGGHVQSGESYEKAALREYAEELGTKSALEPVGKDVYTAKGVPEKFLMTFKTNFNGPFNPDPKAVSRVDFFTMDRLRKMIKDGEKFHPELLFILKKHFL